MKTKLVKIGNSKGVRIPKSLIDEAGLTDEIELMLQNKEIVLKSVSTPRETWADRYKKELEKEDTSQKEEIWFLDNDWDDSEWT